MFTFTFTNKSLILSLLLYITTSQTTNPITDSDVPDCECITGWSYNEIDCTEATLSGTIQTLERYLTIDSINCKEECSTNFECQQSLSLLSQYHDYCPLSTVSEEILRTFWNSSSCTDCFMVKYNDGNAPECENTTNEQCDILSSITELTVD